MQTIKNGFLTVEIAERGAELMSVKDAAGKEYLWQGTAPFWSSRASNIFPVCGRLYQSKYSYKGREYEMGVHGFARKTEFRCIENSGDRAVFRLCSSDASRAMYPFDFVFDVTYVLDGPAVSCRFDILNAGNENMIFAVGGHPGFNVDGIENYTVEFTGKPEKMVFSESYLDAEKTEEYPMRDGRFIGLRHDLFDNDALFFRGVGDKVTLHNGNGGDIVVTCPKANFWGIWHNPKTEAPFVCIEPWYGFPGREGVIEDLTEKKYTVTLGAGEKYDYGYSVEIKK